MNDLPRGSTEPAGAESRLARRPRKGARPATEAEARTLASAIRLRILRLCLDRALTNKEIAQRLDANPATTLHHVRKLVATGFLAPQQERRGARGAREVPYLATGKSWTLDVREVGPSAGNAAMLEAFLSEIRLVDMGEATVSRLGLRLTEPEAADLMSRIKLFLDEVARRPLSPGGRPLSLFLALFPDPDRD